MKFVSALNVFWMLTVATASAGQYTPDFTGERRTASPVFFEALNSAAPAVSPSEPASVPEQAGGFTKGYNPNSALADSPFSPSGMIGKNVFTGNKRGKVTSTQYPWNTIGRLDLPNGGHCTAALVSRDLILTNAHCILDKSTNTLMAGAFVFRPNLTNGASAYSSGVTLAWWGSYPTDKSGDWALMRLAKPLGDNLGWMGVKALPDPRIAQLYAVSYSEDFYSGSSASFETGCTIVSGPTSFGQWLHNCSNSRGSSGSPMFIFEDKLPYVIAIHASEYRASDSSDSEIGIEFSFKKANLAVAADAFRWKLVELLNTK
ncbi:MAG TPA: hypothetical protein DCW72_05960 [Elusimicrobia bacterium]|nr:MAG: hypothetical protein A2X29_10510 [Elusimicrobia bacterium GWA2_64_40]OGR67901.1 MAG: hypothetical protein A2X30_02895 [Elusimicrobia bacterium GWB2_63_16]HAN04446.1 hypothetical protein [Elusimicrobiota bacterium]HAU89773.1 hypothetical protein [Elusimicrobiota bacterium]